MHKKMHWVWGGVFVFLFPSAVQAEIKPNALVSDGMVIQQGKTTTGWGTATGEDNITVELGLGVGEKPVQVTGMVDKDGKWAAHIPAQKAGGPYSLTISGKGSKVEIKEVYIGEVWICSGQSNMEWHLSNCENAEEARKTSQNEKIRLFTVPRLRLAK